MVINHNMSAMFAQRTLGITDVRIGKDIEKLSSGMRINRAGDDASGLAVSEKMRAQIRGLNQASANASNGISFIQVAEAYLQETTDIMQRIRELAVQASNGIYSAEDRMQIQVVGIWLTLSFLNPYAAIAPCVYVIWQNIINAVQLWYKDKYGYLKW